MRPRRPVERLRGPESAQRAKECPRRAVVCSMRTVVCPRRPVERLNGLVECPGENNRSIPIPKSKQENNSNDMQRHLKQMLSIAKEHGMSLYVISIFVICKYLKVTSG